MAAPAKFAVEKDEAKGKVGVPSKRLDEVFYRMNRLLYLQIRQIAIEIIYLAILVAAFFTLVVLIT